MHVSTKDVIGDKDSAKELGVPVGTHILTNTVEGDGPVALASDKAELTAKVIGIQRTASGGVVVQTALFIKEPVAQAPVSVTPNDQAAAYLVSKGKSENEAKAMVAKFGAVRILSAKSEDEAKEVEKLDAELKEALSPAEPADTKPVVN